MLNNDGIKEVFSLIQNQAKKAFLADALQGSPAYFWAAPASSSGKYHPSFTKGKGGLFRHTLAAVKIAIELFDAYPDLTNKDQDNIVIALMLHDTLKKGYPEEKHTVAGHETLPREYYAECAKRNISNEEYDEIMNLVETHMGIWNQNEVPPQPKIGYRISPAEIVHLADYLSSRKAMEYIFSDQAFHEKVVG